MVRAGTCNKGVSVRVEVGAISSCVWDEGLGRYVRNTALSLESSNTFQTAGSISAR